MRGIIINAGIEKSADFDPEVQKDMDYPSSILNSCTQESGQNEPIGRQIQNVHFADILPSSAPIHSLFQNPYLPTTTLPFRCQKMGDRLPDIATTCQSPTRSNGHDPTGTMCTKSINESLLLPPLPPPSLQERSPAAVALSNPATAGCRANARLLDPFHDDWAHW
jgi:hypothetical protein